MKVFIVSPYSGDVEANVAYGKKCVADSIQREETPFAGHLFYTQVLNDDDPEQRDLGMKMGREWMADCEVVAVYVDRGVSKGMIADIEHAQDIDRGLVFRRLEDE